MPWMNEQPIKPLHVTMLVTSRGNAIVHEFQEANTPLDPSRYDHPVTMFYVDADQLNLVHYCDAGNRPRMTGKILPDGKSVEFEFATFSAATSTDTCIMQCSRLSMQITTSRTGHTCCQGTRPSTRTSIFTGRTEAHGISGKVWQGPFWKT